jgi:ribosomal protein L29
MSANTSAPEMRKMQTADLRSEADDLRRSIAKMRMGLTMRSEKNAAEFRRSKRALARMLTVLKEKDAAGDAAPKAEKKEKPARQAHGKSAKKTALKPKANASKVPAPAVRSSAKRSEGGPASTL